MGLTAPQLSALTPQQRVIYDVAKSGCGRVECLEIGRGAKRRRCLGLVTENIDACLERAAERGLRGGRFELVGLRGVVYWPDVPLPAQFAH